MAQTIEVATPVQQDYLLNGKGYGSVAEDFVALRSQVGMRRPFIDEKGNRCVTLNTGRWVKDNKTGKQVQVYQTVPISALMQKGIFHPVWNATSLTKADWIEMDSRVVRAFRTRLRATSDLAAVGTFGGFDAWGRMTIEYQATNDPGEAIVDMEGITPGRTDSPLAKLRSLPLPITHSDFWFSDRRIQVSANGQMKVDTFMAEAAARRIAEKVEATVIGTETGITFGTQASVGYATHDGTSTVYGYTNYPYRITKTDLSTPAGTNPEAVMTDILEAIETMQTNGFYGPYMIYHSTAYSRYLNDDYFRTGSTSAVRTLRERLMEIEGIMDIRRLDQLTSGYQLLIIQMDSEFMQLVDGMGVTLVQWESQGGMRHNFKVMTIKVPMLRAQYSGIAPILHATTS